MELNVKYTNGEVTVLWKPGLCIHSATCAKGLPHVFQPDLRPWVDMEAGSTEEIVNQIKQCPSKALTYIMNADIVKDGE